jgi:hypothetical protein
VSSVAAGAAGVSDAAGLGNKGFTGAGFTGANFSAVSEEFSAGAVAKPVPEFAPLFWTEVFTVSTMTGWLV